MSGILKKTKVMEVFNAGYELKFYEDFNAEGKILNFLEVSMPFGDRIILDGENMEELEKNDLKIGRLDTTFYRDDVGIKIKPVIEITDIPFEIDGKDIILVDDVLFTGRSIRAAMDAIIDLGRPRTIQLAVLVDRGHRELPIRPDYVGKNVPSAISEEVIVHLIETDGKDEVVIISKEESLK